MRYFLELQYKGTSYHGWQRQPNAISIQEVIEDKLSLILRVPITIVGAGRTDAGVHARYITAHFDTDKHLEAKDFVYKLNAIFPADIAAIDLRNVKDDAHARFDAIQRAYEYHLTNYKDPFLEEYAYYIKRTLDFDRMNEAAKLLLKHTNFKCFSKTKTDVKTYNCNISEAYWESRKDRYVFHISADRFLRNMVRAIVGTLIEIGEGKLNIEDMEAIINSQDRNKAGYSVPACGLYLTKVAYPKNIYL
ncbi:tRNA pseudouridine(38-40) synthase TruA [Aquimarina brevivitae]|uniref:tRNA pseudouridine synthase A n=1 Tax=Aquimarina brevivitae TaxID=323412 RepID=A0A4Q7PIE6_9FLAO|nr:tRNA pseudouridine(38-40) synthase TruA [Aquimarina brevivitae]RZT00008.1 tRNA pseudouridine38-40 synthase [Aquimarina brevivitae]